MAFQFSTIKYGWAAVVGLVITGATIYLVNNTRTHIQPVDVIEIILATWERCEATRTSASTWEVAPLSYTKNWRDTNGLTSVNNSISWNVDRAMLVANDAKLLDVIPKYCDTNQNAYTVTGLFATLQIGDGTNFTRTPCWTNQPLTNWTINYTNYYPNTNAPTNFSYTSDVPKQIRYAYSFTSNAFLWTNVWFSNAVTVVTTNDATYGALPWQMYVTDLQERYKVLYSLQRTIQTPTTNRTGRGVILAGGYSPTNEADPPSAWYRAGTNATADFNSQTNNPYGGDYFECYSYGNMQSNVFEIGDVRAELTLARRVGTITCFATTSINHTAAYMYLECTNSFDNPTNATFDANGDAGIAEGYNLSSSDATPSGTITFSIGNTNYPVPNMCDQPTFTTTELKGYRVTKIDIVFGGWQFQYATNKYW